MKKMYRGVIGAMAVALTVLPGQVLAYEEGDWILRVGAVTVDPDVDSDKVDVLGLATLDGVDVDSDTQLSLIGTYMFHSHWGVELLAATPFSHDITLDGTSLDAGSAKQLPPTVSIQYYPMRAGSKVQPYVGAGINYTYFWDEDVDGDLNSALDGIAGLPPGTVDADLDLDDSWGLALQAGIDWAITEKVMLNAGVWWIDIDTEAKISTALGNTHFDVELDPWVYNIGLAFKF